jgi:hypothetical protein
MPGKPRRWLGAIAALGLVVAGVSAVTPAQARATSSVTQKIRADPSTQSGPFEVGNLLDYANTDFEGTLGNWVSVSNATLSDDTSHSFLHNDSLLDTATTAGTSSFRISGTPNAIDINVTPGDSYRVGAYFLAPAASDQTVQFTLNCYDSSGTYIGVVNGTVNTLLNTTKWQYSEDDITVPANASQSDQNGCAYVQGAPKVTLGNLAPGAAVNMDEVIFAPYRAAMIIGAHGELGADGGTKYTAQDWIDTNNTIGPLQSDKEFYSSSAALPSAWTDSSNNCYEIEKMIDQSGGNSADWPACVINFSDFESSETPFSNFFTGLPAQQMVIMLFDGEAEGNPSFSSGSQFQSAFETESQYIRQAAVQSGNAMPNVFVAQGSTTYQYSASTTGNDNAGMVQNGNSAPCQYIVPAGYTDFYLADHYDEGVDPTGSSLPDEPFVPAGATASNGQKWQNWLSCVQPMDKPIGLGEYGLDCKANSYDPTGPDQSQVTAEMGDDNTYLEQTLGVTEPTILWEYWYSDNDTPGCVFDNSAGGITEWQSIETQNGGG